ncbi:class I SAM-dependent methyltransferase [Phytoactinopolyspora mesophila]|uniref:methyltransferase domain-containing protein n=1 Tax=Phytoactinopolyspora mesophila TaxID=2650750 RepID=UPI001C9E74CC|nr:class I SAM-dependent methyltransferase [Phytoactinopolyspora mesophila]
MTELEHFRAVYEVAGVYDQRLLPHFFNGIEDVDLVTDVLNQYYGEAAAGLAVVEFGCGTGRMTSRLAPYSRRLIAADYSPIMIEARSATISGCRDPLPGDPRRGHSPTGRG